MGMVRFGQPGAVDIIVGQSEVADGAHVSEASTGEGRKGLGDTGGSSMVCTLEVDGGQVEAPSDLHVVGVEGGPVMAGERGNWLLARSSRSRSVQRAGMASRSSRMWVMRPVSCSGGRSTSVGLRPLPRRRFRRWAELRRGISCRGSIWPSRLHWLGWVPNILCWLLVSSARVSCAEITEMRYHAVQSTI